MKSAYPSMAALGDVAHDDLSTTLDTISEFDEDLKQILKDIPSYVNQVGAVILDADGVYGLELYDHPDSWKAFSESIMESYGEALKKEDKEGIFKPDLTKITPIIFDFIQKLKDAKTKTKFDSKGAKTVVIEIEGFVGEYTELNDNTIHVSIVRRKKERTRKKPRDLLKDAMRDARRQHTPTISLRAT